MMEFKLNKYINKSTVTVLKALQKVWKYNLYFEDEGETTFLYFKIRKKI